GGGEPQPVLTNVMATHPSVARDGSRLLFSRENVDDPNIWMIPGPAAHSAGAADPVPVIASTFFDSSPAVSDAGDRIAFVSKRSGSFQIWTAKVDGSNSMQLTRFDSAINGSPRWSPDGKWIAFDS